jgi:hypothetical protein
VEQATAVPLQIYLLWSKQQPFLCKYKISCGASNSSSSANISPVEQATAVPLQIKDLLWSKLYLKGQCHEIFNPPFFSSIDYP